FTLNLGVRWEPFTPQVRGDKRSGTFRKDWFDQGLTSKVFLNAPKGHLYSVADRPNGVPGDNGMPDNAPISNNLWVRFAPRARAAGRQRFANGTSAFSSRCREGGWRRRRPLAIARFTCYGAWMRIHCSPAGGNSRGSIRFPHIARLRGSTGVAWRP